MQPYQGGSGYGTYDEAQDATEGAVKSKYSTTTKSTMDSLRGVDSTKGDLLDNFARAFGDSDKIQNALTKPGDPEKIAENIEALKDIALETAKGDSARGEALLRALAAKSVESQVAANAAIEELRSKRGRELTGANVAVQGQSLLKDLRASTSGFVQDDQASIDAIKQSKGSAEDFIAQQYQRLKEYTKMMSREEADYNLNRARSNEDYNRQIAYSQEDFYRGQRYQKQDFHRSMLRQEEDYQLQLTRMVEDASRTMYDPFSRVMSQGARSGGSQLFNLKEQNELIKAQREGIDKLKEMGLSQAAIDDLGLMDPGKAQQVAYWADGGIDKKEIAGTNKAIGRRRDLAGDMVLSDDNQGFRRQEEDREKMIERSTKDFHRGLRRSTEEFLRQMERGEKEYHRSLNRMDADREKNLERAKKDMLGFMRDAQKTVEEQAAYVNKIIGKMNNRVGDVMISMVDKMLVAIDKAERVLSGDDQKFKKFLLNDGATLDGDGATVGGDGASVRPRKEGRTKGDYNGSDGGAKRNAPIGDWLEEMGKKDIIEWLRERFSGSGATWAEGGIVTKPTYGVVGEAGYAEAIIPLNSRGAKFMADSLAMMHTKGKNMSYGEASSAMNVYNNNTNFNGEIRIEAQDPNEMTRKLKHKARMNALRGGKESIYA